MEQLIITQTSESELLKKISELIDHKLASKKDVDAFVSRLDLANGNWGGGIKMSVPTQDKHRRSGLLKASSIGGKIFYRESQLLSL